MTLSSNDVRDLKLAKMLLEQPNFASRMTAVVGTPLEKALGLLPGRVNGMISTVTEKALMTALGAAVKTMRKSPPGPSADKFHKLAVSATGFAGGLFGLPALAVELPVTTALIMRSVADIARSEGEDLSLVPTRLACMEVFALGGRPPRDGVAETGYYAIRAAMSAAGSDAAAFIMENGLVETGAPALVRLISQIGTRFGVIVSEKFAAEAIPVIGAAGGAMINTIFIDHFQDVSRGHFIVRRLEQRHGKEPVQSEYENIFVEKH